MPTPVTLVSDFRLENKLAPLMKDPRFRNMRVAVMDLALSTRRAGSGGGLNLFAGWNVHKTRYSASLVKISAMFAAFQLRENLNAAAATITAKSQEDLFQQIKAAWAPVVERAVRGPKNFPQLAKIFDAVGSGSSWTCDFTGDYWNALADMIGPSNNEAAATCISALGHQYINGALAAEELYTAHHGGLWLGATYAGTNWQMEAGGKSHITASPWAVARFLTMLQTDRLVSPAASDEMRTMMTNCYQQRILRSKSRPFVNEFGKLGIGYKGGFFDGGVVERPKAAAAGGAAARRVCYGVVMLDAVNVNPVMKDLGLAIDDVMMAWSP
jgi:hypothetical protein